MSEEERSDLVQYSCHPIRTLSFGTQFKFENGVLTLTPEDAEVFEKMLEGSDTRTRYQVKKIDATLAESIVRSLLISGATKSIDSVAGGDTTRATEVGTEAIEVEKEVNISTESHPPGAEKLAGPLGGGLNLSGATKQ